MKLPAFLLLICLWSTFSYGQKREEYYDWQWHKTDAPHARFYSVIEKKGDVWWRQDYFLHERRLQMEGAYKDESFKTATGEFHYYHSNGALESVGKYENGKRQGLWLSYHSNGMISDSAFFENGNVVGTRMLWYTNGFPMDSAVWNRDGSGVMVSWFDNGAPAGAGRYAAGYKQDGKWRYFHKNGQTSSVEVYGAGKLLSRQYYAEDGSEIKDTSSTDRDAAPTGGAEAWKKFLLKNLYFPSQWQLANSDQAVVTVTWYVDEEGNIKEPFVSTPLHPDFDKIALEAFGKAPKWIPERRHNRNIKSYHTQPITFSQE